MGASLMAFLARPAAKLSVGVLVVAILTLFYFYWEHKIYQSGRNDERIEWMKRDAETERQGQELLKLRLHEKEVSDKQNAERAFNAAKIYSDHYERVIADRKRMPISTTQTGVNYKPVSGASKSAKGVGGTDKEIHESRISEGTLRSIEDGQLACEKLLNIMVSE